jgi:hypothetical protein
MRERMRADYAQVAIGVSPAMSTGQMKGWVESRARAAEDDLFDPDAKKCAGCHELATRPARDGGRDVAKVEPTPSWIARSEFSHRAHELAPCAQCHPAAAVQDPGDEVPAPAWSHPGAGPWELLSPAELEQRHGLTPSEHASDVLVPRIATCQSAKCHGGREASAPRTASACDLCHRYHHADLPAEVAQLIGGR